MNSFQPTRRWRKRTRKMLESVMPCYAFAQCQKCLRVHQFSWQINVTLVTHTVFVCVFFLSPRKNCEEIFDVYVTRRVFKQNLFFGANKMMDENRRFSQIEFWKCFPLEKKMSLGNFAHGSWFKMLLDFFCHAAVFISAQWIYYIYGTFTRYSFHYIGDATILL